MRTLKKPAKRAAAAAILASCTLGITAAANAATTQSSTTTSLIGNRVGPFNSSQECFNAKLLDYEAVTTPCVPIPSYPHAKWYYSVISRP